MARRRTRRARTWDGCSCGSGSGRRGALGCWAWRGSRALATHCARGRGRAGGARAARIPVGSCQGRGAGKACAGARGKCARKSWCWARGELGADGGESTHSVCRARCRALCEALLRANRCYLVGFSCARACASGRKAASVPVKRHRGEPGHTRRCRYAPVLHCTVPGTRFKDTVATVR